MSDIPLPEPHGQFLVWNYHAKPDDPVQYRDVWIDDQMHAHAAAVSAADNASLRADNVRLQNEVVGPLRERVKVLEDALQRVRNDKSFHCLKIEKTQQYIIAALGDKP